MAVLHVCLCVRAQRITTPPPAFSDVRRVSPRLLRRGGSGRVVRACRLAAAPAVSQRRSQTCSDSRLDANPGVSSPRSLLPPGIDSEATSDNFDDAAAFLTRRYLALCGPQVWCASVRVPLLPRPFCTSSLAGESVLRRSGSRRRAGKKAPGRLEPASISAPSRHRDGLILQRYKIAVHSLARSARGWGGTTNRQSCACLP